MALKHIWEALGKRLTPDVLRKLAHLVVAGVMVLVVHKVRRAVKRADRRRELLSRKTKHGSAVKSLRVDNLKYDRDEDTFEILRDSDYCDVAEEEIEDSDVRQVERVLEEREEARGAQVSKFLQDLQDKKRQVLMSRILTSREGPQLLSSQKQLLLKDLRRARDQDEDAMSVDETEVAPLQVKT